MVAGSATATRGSVDSRDSEAQSNSTDQQRPRISDSHADQQLSGLGGSEAQGLRDSEAQRLRDTELRDSEAQRGNRPRPVVIRTPLADLMGCVSRAVQHFSDGSHAEVHASRDGGAAVGGVDV